MILRMNQKFAALSALLPRRCRIMKILTWGGDLTAVSFAGSCFVLIRKDLFTSKIFIRRSLLTSFVTSRSK